MKRTVRSVLWFDNGLIHAKSGINTMFNTGSVCVVFLRMFLARDFRIADIPDFGWGGADGFRTFRID